MKTITIEMSDEQYIELMKEGQSAKIKVIREKSPIDIIIDHMFQEDYGVDFDDFNLETTPLLKKAEGK